MFFHVNTETKNIDWCSKGNLINIQNYLYFTSDINSNRNIIINPSNDDIIMDEQVAQASKIVLVHLEEIIGSTIYKEKYRSEKSIY